MSGAHRRLICRSIGTYGIKIVVTGGAGYIGSHTVLELAAAGHNVLSCDNYCNSSPEALTRVRRLTNARIREAHVDVRDQSRLDEVMADFRPDVVIHFAGIKAVGASRNYTCHPVRPLRLFAGPKRDRRYERCRA